MADKPSIRPVRWQAPPIEPIRGQPSKPVTVVRLSGDGPEDVVVDAEGWLWAGVLDGRIIRVSPDGATQTVVADTGGRPLGLHVARDGRVLVCDSHRGLLALDPASGELTVLTETAGGPDGVGSAGSVPHHRLKFCSNVTETEDGTIYFTESTKDFHFEHFGAPVLEARGTGGLYRLASDGTVTTLSSGLYFANGVTVTSDGSALVFAETLARRLSKYWLTGDKAGTVTRLAEHLPGMPDNISTGSDGRIWTAMVTAAKPGLDRLLARPPWIRQVVWRLPPRFQPKVEPEIWVVAFDPDSGAVIDGVRTTHPDFGGVTGVVESAGKLWMSTIEFPALAYCEL